MGIGNFKAPAKAPIEPTMAQQAPQAPKATPASVVTEAVKESLRADVSDTSTVSDKAVTYEEILESVGLTREKAYDILDAVLLEGFYQDIIALTPKVSVTLRSRVYGDIVRYHQAVERTQPQYTDAVNEMKLRYNLSASLAAFRGHTFEFPTPTADNKDLVERAFQERMAFVESLSEEVVQLLCQKLHTFDRQVYAALNEGAAEFF